MKRHLFLRLFQLASAVAMVLVGLFAPISAEFDLVHGASDSEGQPSRSPLEFSVALLGENELATGMWEGVDLLHEPRVGVSRAQLTLSTKEAAYVTLEELTPQGPVQVFPQFGPAFKTEPGQSYAVPGPSSFFDVMGETRLRLVVRPVTAPVDASPAFAQHSDVGAAAAYPLTDGKLQRVVSRKYVGTGPAKLELTLEGNGLSPQLKERLVEPADY